MHSPSESCFARSALCCARALLSRQGVTPAPSRAAFGFRLGEDNAAAIASWVAEAGARCTLEKAGLVRQCETDSLAHFGVEGTGTVFFRADDAERLVAVLVTARLPDAQASLARTEWVQALTRTLGEPHTERGETTQALLSQRRSEHHFSDLLASVSATQMGDGVRVNLELQSL